MAQQILNIFYDDKMLVIKQYINVIRATNSQAAAAITSASNITDWFESKPVGHINFNLETKTNFFNILNLIWECKVPMGTGIFGSIQAGGSFATVYDAFINVYGVWLNTLDCITQVQYPEIYQLLGVAPPTASVIGVFTHFLKNVNVLPSNLAKMSTIRVHANYKKIQDPTRILLKIVKITTNTFDTEILTYIAPLITTIIKCYTPDVNFNTFTLKTVVTPSSITDYKAIYNSVKGGSTSFTYIDNMNALKEVIPSYFADIHGIYNISITASQTIINDILT